MVYTISREDAARMLGVSTRTIDRYVSSGKIRSKRDGKLLLLHEDDIEKQRSGGQQKDYEVIDLPKPLSVQSTSYDPRESHTEIMHAIESVIREKDAVIQDLTFKIGKIE